MTDKPGTSDVDNGRETPANAAVIPATLHADETIDPASAATIDPSVAATIAPDASALETGSTLPPPGLMGAPSGILEATPESAGRYEAGRELGRGGIGRVFLAFDQHLKRQIAVKELLKGVSAGGLSLSERTPGEQRFVREAWVTGQLEHPGIVPVYELGLREDGTLYYTMQVVRGRTLAEVISDTQSLADRLRLLSSVLDLCQAIAYAHSRGVIHRDLKPGNVMLGEFGETIVLDWGLAKVQGDEDIRGEELADVVAALRRGELGQTIAGAPMGTPAYMSPEQAAGDAARVDARSDVFSLGVILYELLSGHLPFDAAHLRELLTKVATTSAPPILTRAPDIPADLAAIVDRACAHDPDARYRDAGALAADLEAYVEGQQVSVYAYSSLELVRRFIARNRALSVTALALFVVAVVGVVVVSLAYRDVDHARDAALTQQKRAEAARDQARAAEATAEAERDRAEAERLTSLRRLSDAYAERAQQLIEEHQLLYARVFAAAALQFSGAHPKGAYRDAATLSSVEAQEARARLLSLYTASRSALRYEAMWPHPEGSRGIALAYSPDGRRLARGDFSGHLALYDAENAKEMWRTNAAPGQLQGVAFSPDGRQVAHVGLVDHAVFISDVESGETRTLSLDRTRDFGLLFDVAFSLDGRRLFVAGMDAPKGSPPGTAHAELSVWSAREECEVQRMVWPEHRMMGGLVVSPDGERLAAVMVPSWSVELFDAQTLERLGALPEEAGETRGVVFIDEDRLLTLGHDGALRVWGREGALLQSVETGGVPDDLVLSTDRRWLALTGVEPQLWSTAPLSRVERLPHAGRATLMALGPEGRQIASASEVGSVSTWRFDAGVEGRLPANGEPPYLLRFSPDGERLMTAPRQGVGSVWDLTRRVVRPLDDQDSDTQVLEGSLERGPAPGVVVAQAGQIIARSSSGEVRLGAVNPGMSRTLVACRLELGRCARSTVLSQIEFWDIVHGERLHVISVPFNYIIAMDVSLDGSLLLAADEAGNVLLFSLERRRLLWRRQLHDHPLISVAFAPDGERFVASGDGLVGLWETVSGERVAPLKGTQARVQRVGFSPDGERVAAVSQDAYAFLWRTSDLAPLRRWSLDGNASAMAFHPGGKRLAVATRGGISMLSLDEAIWESSPEVLLRDAERAAGVALDGMRLDDRRGDPQAPPPAPVLVVGESRGKIGVMNIENINAPLPEDARVTMIDASGGEPLDPGGPLEVLEGGRLGFDLPVGIDHVGLEARWEEERAVFISPWLRRGVHDWELDTFPRFISALVTQKAGFAPPDDAHVLVLGTVFWGDLGRFETSESVACARVSLGGGEDDVVRYAFVNFASMPESTLGSGLFIISRLEAGRGRVVTVEAGEVTKQVTIPPLPGGTTLRLHVLITREESPEHPTATDCVAPPLE